MKRSKVTYWNTAAKYAGAVVASGIAFWASGNPAANAAPTQTGDCTVIQNQQQTQPGSIFSPFSFGPGGAIQGQFSCIQDNTANQGTAGRTESLKYQEFLGIPAKDANGKVLPLTTATDYRGFVEDQIWYSTTEQDTSNNVVTSPGWGSLFAVQFFPQTSYKSTPMATTNSLADP